MDNMFKPNLNAIQQMRFNGMMYQPTYSYQPQPMTQPYQTQMPNYQMPYSQEQQPSVPQMPLNGRVVSSADDIMVNEVPQNGNPAFFPTDSGDAILVKRWKGDGTIETVRYVPEQTPDAPSSQPQSTINSEQLMEKLSEIETLLLEQQTKPNA